MAWKEILKAKCEGVPGLAPKTDGPMYSTTIKALVVPIERDLSRKTIRVTVEEEVSECCEKWRGSEIARVQWFGNPHEMLRSWPTFCPECGRKL